MKSLIAMRTILEDQLISFSSEDGFRSSKIKKLSTISGKSNYQNSVQAEVGDIKSHYLVNMIKSVEDPSQERYVLIATLDDFNLIYRSDQFDGERFAIAETQSAIAIQFEEKNFLNIDFMMTKIKINWAQSRINYMDSIFKRVQQKSSKSQMAVLTEIFQQQEMNHNFHQKSFKDSNNLAIGQSLDFIKQNYLQNIAVRDQL